MEQKLETKQEEYKQTELGELPKEWEVVRIQEIVKFERGTEPGSKNYNDKRKGIRFLRVSDISGNRKEFIFITTSNKIKSCSPENVLITFDGSPGIVKKGFAGAYSSGIRKVNILNDSTDLNYIFYVLQSNFVQEIILKYSTGVTIKHASKSIPHIKIPLPPLPEQQKIAYVLSTVQNAQEKTENFINSLKEFKKSAMKHLFTYGAVPFDEIDKVELKETEIGMMPKEWEETKIKEVTKKIKRGASKKTNDKEGVVYMTSDYLTDDGNITFKTIKYLSCTEVKFMKNYLVDKKDLIVNCVNSLEKIGKTGVFEGYSNEVVIGFNNYALSLDLLKIDPYFIKYFLLSSEGKKNIQRITNPAVKQASFASNHLLTLTIPFPPLFVQQRIASILSIIDEKIQAEEQKKEALKEIFNSLLKNLMTAKIRVNNLEVGV